MNSIHRPGHYPGPGHPLALANPRTLATPCPWPPNGPGHTHGPGHPLALAIPLALAERKGAWQTLGIPQASEELAGREGGAGQQGGWVQMAGGGDKTVEGWDREG